jgi:hypothetical protein
MTTIDKESDPGSWAEHQKLMELFNKLTKQSNDEAEKSGEG